jgi:hypothetical protein
MTSAVQSRPARALPLRALGMLRDMGIGTILCLTPVTSLLALGWMTRRMGARIETRWGAVADRPGWILGAAEAGLLQRLLGGLAANVETGLRSALGLFLLTLPFTLAWLGAWWAGWENSFNKGYEQSAVGPSVWMLATLVSLPILAHLPLALAHGATERRLGAFFEWRRIRSVGAAAGWRLAWIAVLSVAASAAVFALRALPVFVEGWVPGFADMSATQQADIAGQIDLAVAALVFASVAYLRHRAAVIYAIAAPRAAKGRYTGLWSTHAAARVHAGGRTPSRAAATLWLVLACLIWLGLPVLIVAGQFLNYAPAHWIVHPVITLPWAG